MIEIELHHHKAFVTKYSSIGELETLKEKLKFFIRNFMPINGRQYTVENILSEKDFSFPSAYITILEKILKDKKIELKVTDKRVYPGPHLYLKNTGELPPLFETQTEAMLEIVKNYTGIIAKATGSGKTRTILETVLLRQVKTLILVPTEDIKMNMAEIFAAAIGANNVSTSAPSIKDELEIKRLKAANEPETEEPKLNVPSTSDSIARLTNLFSKNRPQTQNNTFKKLSNLYSKDSFKDGNIESPESRFLKGKIERTAKDSRKADQELRKLQRKFEKKIKPVTIICYQSLSNISELFLAEIEMLIIDEAHTASVAQIRNASLKMNKAAFRYFFTATPWRDLKPQMHLLLSVIGDHIIYELKGKTAADKKIIAMPHLSFIEAPKPNVYLDPKKLKNPRQRKVQGIIANESRNAFIVQKCIDMYHEGHNIFIAVDEIEHLNILAARFAHQKIEVNIIHGELNSLLKRERVKKAGANEGSLITIGTMAVGIGTDMPNVDVVFLASGGKSSIRFIQRIGRGSRKTKSDFYIYDLWDWFNDRLLEHSKERFKIYKEEFEELSNLESRFKLYS
jgi:superfamily II DNA or RNA helicase